MALTDWTIEADDVLALPLDDLALRVLQDARDNREWNWQNWLKSASTNAYRQRSDVLLGPVWSSDHEFGRSPVRGGSALIGRWLWREAISPTSSGP